MTNEFQQEIIDEKLRLKNDIKRTSGNFAKMLLILVISIYLIGFTIIFAIKIKSMLLGIDSLSKYELDIINDSSSDIRNFFVGYLPCIIGDIIAIIFAIKTTKIKLKENILTKNRATKTFVLLGTISSIGAGIISSIIYSIYLTIFEAGGITIPQPDFSFPTNKIYLILFLLYVCLIGPILEELIFRGFILKSMQKYGNMTAIVVSSILFSMFHLNLVQFVNPILMGIIFAFITIKSKSIFPSMIAHIFNNTITFSLVGMLQLKSPLLEYVVIPIYSLAGIVSITLFITKYRKDFIEITRNENNICTTFEKIKYSFSGKWTLVYLTFYIVFVGGTIILTNI